MEVMSPHLLPPGEVCLLGLAHLHLQEQPQLGLECLHLQDQQPMLDLQLQPPAPVQITVLITNTTNNTHSNNSSSMLQLGQHGSKLNSSNTSNNNNNNSSRWE